MSWRTNSPALPIFLARKKSRGDLAWNQRYIYIIYIYICIYIYESCQKFSKQNRLNMSALSPKLPNHPKIVFKAPMVHEMQIIYNKRKRWDLKRKKKRWIFYINSMTPKPEGPVSFAHMVNFTCIILTRYFGFSPNRNILCYIWLFLHLFDIAV